MFYEDEYEIKQTKGTPDKIGKGLSQYRMIDRLGRLQTNTGVDRIAQSIRNILETPIGSRFFMPSFGSKVLQLVHEPNDYILKNLTVLYVTEAISTWEPRVAVQEVLVDTDTDPEICYVQVLYKVKGMNNVQAVVYSFRRENSG